MSDVYGTAFMKIHHDISVDVRERFASGGDEKYLTLPGAETDISSLLSGTRVYVEPLFFTDIDFRHKTRTRRIDDIVTGSRVIATLTKHVFYMTGALQDKGVALQNGANTYYFSPKELENLLDSAKKKMFRDLSSAGLEPDIDKMYFSLTGNCPLIN
ncbi:hypothetical protein J4423_01900 [Candidatus Pacearchaeota archaeon]|nr:hypothetical protein [Candidatus Pacearchaeota archaeon]